MEVTIESKYGREFYIVNPSYLDRNTDQTQESYYPRDLDVLEKVFGERIKMSKKMVEYGRILD